MAVVLLCVVYDLSVIVKHISHLNQRLVQGKVMGSKAGPVWMLGNMLKPHPSIATLLADSQLSQNVVHEISRFLASTHVPLPCHSSTVWSH